MPQYDYKCKCGWEKKEVFRTIADRVMKCESCGEELRPAFNKDSAPVAVWNTMGSTRSGRR